MKQPTRCNVALQWDVVSQCNWVWSEQNDTDEKLAVLPDDVSRTVRWNKSFGQPLSFGHSILAYRWAADTSWWWDAKGVTNRLTDWGSGEKDEYLATKWSTLWRIMIGPISMAKECKRWNSLGERGPSSEQDEHWRLSDQLLGSSRWQSALLRCWSEGRQMQARVGLRSSALPDCQRAPRSGLIRRMPACGGSVEDICRHRHILHRRRPPINQRHRPIDSSNVWNIKFVSPYCITYDVRIRVVLSSACNHENASKFETWETQQEPLDEDTSINTSEKS